MRLSPSWQKSLSFFAGVSMLAAIAALPITSLPLLSRLMGGTQVAPPSVLLACMGLVFILPVTVARKALLPAEWVPLAAFVAVALAAALLSFFFPQPEYKQLSIYREAAQAAVTLLVGIACFLSVSAWARQPGQFGWVFRLVNITGVLIVIWSAIQVYYTNFQSGHYPGWALAVHDSISTQSLLNIWYNKRAQGFAYEPSWLAHQLNTFYLPYWLGATITGYSAFRFRSWRISAENILLILGVAVMFMSMSRIGYLALMLVIAYLFLQLGTAAARRLAARIAIRRGLARSETEYMEKRYRMAAGPLLMAGFALFGALSVYLLSLIDPRIAAIFEQQYAGSNFFFIANNLSLAERFAYWGLGWNVFSLKPLLGVGLGNIGFYFETHLPQFGWSLNEMLKLIFEGNTLVNSKNLWTRLLAETGVTGFSFFVTWLTVVYISARTLMHHASPLFRTLGWLGVLAVIALVGEGFSVDTFALPYYWISFGLAVAGSFTARQSTSAAGAPAPGVEHD